MPYCGHQLPLQYFTITRLYDQIKFCIKLLVILLIFSILFSWFYYHFSSKQFLHIKFNKQILLQTSTMGRDNNMYMENSKINA